MCGIAGYVGHGVDEQQLANMAAALTHRGPDSAGFHVRNDTGFAIRRLRIIDLVTGDQPITSLCTGATIVYNGELYNYRELRTELEAAGHRFRTQSDTEVVLHFYEEHGVSGFQRLNGIFAFAIDDPVKQLTVLARDHVGVKPLYLAEVRPDLILFASEPKGLIASGVVETSIDRVALATYLALGHSSEKTIYARIHKLPPGHAMIVGSDGYRSEQYWDVLARARRWSAAAPPMAELAELIADAVERNMIADVPVGAFLSGGVDSSLVTALMRTHTTQLHTFSVGFDQANDERSQARSVARTLGTEHTEIVVTARDAAAALPQLVHVYDEPFADAAAIPTYLMSVRAREDVTVVLTGEGGDELFGGYRRYVAEQSHHTFAHIPAAFRRAAARLAPERMPALRRPVRAARALAVDERAVRFATWTEVFDSTQRRRLLDGNDADPYSSYREATPDAADVPDDVVAMMAVELRTWLVDAYLEKVDKATMAASLEARVPLLDPRLVEFMALAPRSWKIRGRHTKVLLREIARRYVPQDIAARPKHGFSPPYADWLRTTLEPEVLSLGSQGSCLADLVDGRTVRDLVARFRRGEPREGQIWALLCLELWARENASSSYATGER